MAAPAPAFEVRDLRFDLDDAPRDWHPAGAAVTRFFDNLSLFFPAGEVFFIKSVKAHRDHVTDPALAEAVRKFYAQEAFHGREHRRYNRWLRDHGYPVAALEAGVERLLGRVERYVPRRWKLAATCALEHFTALMGHLLLSDPAVLADAHPAFAELWRWHSVEESEHKGVAYDVYEAAGGNTPERALIMLATTLIFWGKVVEHQVRLMQVDGTARSPRAWGELVGFLFADPGPLRAMIPLYLAWFAPGFHPWDVDTRPLIERWKSARAVA